MYARTSMLIAAVALLAAACGSTTPTLPPVPSTIATDVGGTDAAPATTTTSVTEEADEAPSTTTTVFSRLAEPPETAPPFEVVTITTPDGLDLYGEFWEGDDIAVLYTHEYDAAAAGGNGQRPPQSSATLTNSTWTIAAAGHTVLAFDFRGHGQSPGTYSVKESQIDMRAAYDFLTERGFDTIVGMAATGSAPVMADLAADDPEFDLAGLGMLFTPLGETGFDAGTALAGVDEPVWLVGIDSGSYGGITKKLERKVNTLYDRIIFPAVPSGVLFADVYGAEYLGRQLDFIETVAAG